MSAEEEKKDQLVGRELPSAVNTPELIAEHLKATNGKVRTRFPPEPNGYLHVGHCKSMNMNFELAFEKLGVPKENRQTIFRFDDTNPEAESEEYIQSLHKDVAWLGWKPDPVTFTSDYFPKLHELAVELIKRGKAYVCHQSKADIETSRDINKKRLGEPDNVEAQKASSHSPWRDRPIEESLKEFENMRKGKYGPTDIGGMPMPTLRMKMDMESPNPNMWDQVAYRIKYVAHPHAGSDWCIYPTYDYTHCIIDSLEHVDYSICTLEFETRRESYFWVLEALDLYRPKVYEMSRLNLTNTVLSKRRLLKLVDNGYMRGWSDPRMPTIQGLRRRGYTPPILNGFCREIGATRNANVVQYERLAAQARTHLHEVAPRVMGVVDPIRVVITGDANAEKNAGLTHAEVPHYPFDTTRGTHPVPLPHVGRHGKDTIIYIDSGDFREVDDKSFYGLAPNKVVGLRYYQRIKCTSYETDSNGKVSEIKCTFVGDEDPTKPKVYIQWVGEEDAVPVEVRSYSGLFSVEEPSDDWEVELNPTSEQVSTRALVDSSVFLWNPISETSFQLERIGFYTVDVDTTLPINWNDDSNSKLTLPDTTVGKSVVVTVKECDAARQLWGFKSSEAPLTCSARPIVFNQTVGLNSSKPGPVAADGTVAAASGANRSRKDEQMAMAAEKERMKKIPPQEMFKVAPNDVLYKEYDAEGIPTVNAAGEPITKSAAKKLKKEWEKQKKLFESANK